MKNTPITARVKSGMFKTKEPLLNVGPAGVDGNNKTRTMPSPSKMKGYSMKSSPFKDLTEAEKSAKKENEVTLKSGGNNSGVKTQSTEIVKTAGDIVKGKEITRNKSWDDLRAEGMSEEKITEAKAWRKKNPNAARDQVDTGTFEPDTVGPDKETKVEREGDLYRKSTGKAQSAYDRRNNFRANTRANRGVNKNERKLEKYGTFNDKGDFTQRDNLSQKELRKMRGAQSKLSFAKQEVKNTQAQSEQNVGGFSKANVRNEGVKMKLEDFTVDEQKKIPNKTDKGNAPKKTGLFDQFKKSPAEMSNPSFFKKKSPIKMNYFKK